MGTDVIAGFPGEGDKEFQNTYNLLKEMPFSYLHVFPYSERPGTEASKLPGKVPSEVKKFRSFELRGLSLRKKALFHKQMEGFSADLLLEQKTASGFLGTTGNYIKAHLRAAGQHRLRSIVNVRLKAGPEGYVLAKPVSDE
jgi:threonylcarbamoyladenosine tRNA methylthiotransferase MtaB